MKPSVSSGREQVSVSSKSRFARLRALTSLAEQGEFLRSVFAAPAMLDLFATLDRARNSRAPILLLGETGTGKEVIARAAHALSTRRRRKFLGYNCASANPDLLESQLFGHQRGSFTGATCDSIGIIRDLEGGALLLDEIGELPLHLQPKLLRFLQEGEVHPVGAPRPLKTDVRIIAATNRDLEAEVRAGRFREDLYERLNVLRFVVPPLRERREEIPPFIEHFLERYQEEEHKQGLRLSEEAMALLLNYDWPRNVRQLGNEIWRLVVLAENDDVIGVERLSQEIRANAQTIPLAEIVECSIRISLSLTYPERQGELQKLSIINALTETNGNLKQAAARIKMSRNGFKNAIKRFGVDVEKCRQPKIQ